MDIPSFLHQYPPFDDLDEERLGEIVVHTHIEFFPAGEVILQQSGEPAKYLYVVRTGVVEMVDEDQVLDHLGEGEVFGHPSMLSGFGPTFTVRAHEETLCYLIDREEAESILGTASGLAFLSSTLRRRVVRALEGLAPETGDPWRTHVGALVRRPPVTCPASFTAREAAELMTREKISSLLIPLANGWGIVTDRDLRSRVLALGRSAETHVTEICTTPLVTLEGQSKVAEVIPLMLERGIHHIPIVDERGEVFGVVTDTDVMGLEQKSAFQLKSEIERAATVEAVVEAGRELPRTVCGLVEGNVDPIDIGHVVAVAIDALTRRFLELGIRRFGDPSAKWAWLALGSEARQEQALLTDQDNALAYDAEDMPKEMLDPYFAKLGEFVNEHLEAAGIPRCRAGVNAEQPEWRRSVPEWVLQFRRWMSDIGETGRAFIGIAFDYRQVAGPLELGPVLDEVIRKAPGQPGLLGRLARAASAGRPPTGFLKDSVAHRKGRTTPTLDVKHGGITLITSIARASSLAAGVTEIRTLRRLRDATAAGKMSEEVREGLEEAFRLLWQIRLEHQAGQVRAGVQPDDLVDPRTLGPLARQGLKDAFRMIERAQAGLQATIGVHRL